MRIAIGWSRISGYFAASLRALAAHPGVEVRVLAMRPEAHGHYPFDERILPAGIDVVLRDPTEFLSPDLATTTLAEFRPDVAVVSGWAYPAFRALLTTRSAEWRDTPIVMGLDNIRTGSLRQWLAPLVMRRLFRRVNAWWVPGSRSAELLRYWRIDERRVFRGLYAVDEERYAPVASQRTAAGSWPRVFAFVGQYIHRKGIDTLVDAYRRYRATVGEAHAWPLVCYGSGPERARLQTDGIEDRGFLQPDELPARLLDAGALILPSRLDHWGVVVVEAATAGLPVIATDHCGVAADVIEPGRNGFVVPAGDAVRLADAMQELHRMPDTGLAEMGRASQQLAAPYASARWAERLLAVAAACDR